MKKLSKLFIFATAIILISVAWCGVEAGAESSKFFVSEKVYIGGFPIGISTLGEGLYVDGIASIESEDGFKIPLENKGIDKGDILLKVNGFTVDSREDVAKSIKPNQTNKLEFFSNGKEFTVESVPVKDKKTNNYFLGLFLSNGIEGIGTMTFIREDNTFSALGHPITKDDGMIGEVYKGKIYEADITSLTPSRPNNPGQLNGNIEKDSPIGELTKNTPYGIYGKISDDTLKTKMVQTTSRLLISTGKASIYTTLNGNTPDYYDIEILTLTMQPKIKEKGILFKVTDPRLLSAGGVMQGMSGSPILQEGKLIGAVTHVLIDEPTKGYGIYSDFLLESM